MYCPHCGYPNSGAEKDCPDCGKSLATGGPAMSRMPQASSDPAAAQSPKRELGASKLQAREKLTWTPKKLK
jgi:uncharacterized membrane protein YvbJ